MKSAEITRETMRADGITVGQSMDNDAAFLRRLGIDAKDGQPTVDEKLESFQNKVRDAILGALDKTVPSGKGWNDGDLTNLFASIDRHSEELFWREFYKL